VQCLCGVPLNKTEPPSVLASYSSLLTPAFVACSTNVGEGLVKLMTCSDISRRWVDMRRSGTFPEKPQVSMLPIATTDHAVTKGLTSGSQVQCSLGDISWVQKAASQLYRMCHSSTCPPNIQVRNCTWSDLPPH